MTTAEKLEARKRQGELGQFFTPAPLADFMASLFGPLPAAVRLLDAGAGASALTRAFVERLSRQKDGVVTVEATLYEIDPLLLDDLTATMRDCERICDRAGIGFTYAIHSANFIEATSASLAGNLFAAPPPAFDAAIVNPPYRKINSASAERRALRSAGVETSNLYTGFIALIQRLLVPGGQLVGITPRSFCNGRYFRPFREDFLSNLELRRLHVFESRSTAFRSDDVLQENVIFHVAKGKNQPPEVVVSSSSGEGDGAVIETVVPFADVVHRHEKEKFIHIPSASMQTAARQTMSGLSSTLESLGVSVSTGRVVDFRLKNALRQAPEGGTAPLVYPCHFNGGTIHWPKLDGRKPNAILDTPETRPWLVPSGVYLLTKRFTSKEERRRLVACLFDRDDVQAEWLGFENHLNYFHESGHGLERSLALGLFAFLNSTLVDQYFRRFSGNTQVNATDLRSLPYPDRACLQAMGNAMMAIDFTQGEIDALVAKHIHTK